MSNSILIVQNEPKTALFLREKLEKERYDVSAAATGDDAFVLIQTRQFDMILLDLLLPDRDGISLLTAMRQRQLDTPVLILTAVDTISSRVHALDQGADDYVATPFAFEELLARIGALLRRSRAIRLCAGDLEINLLARSVTRAGTVIELTDREFDMLEYLMRQQGRVVLREDLARDLWADVTNTSHMNNLIDVHIRKLRKKIELPGTSRLIRTVRSIGFVLNAGDTGDETFS